jgi:N-dimethylarginine dimethylaminohydrolase
MKEQVLMAAPDYFDVREVKNEFMRAHLGGINHAEALAQWNALREAFETCGVQTRVMPALPKCEDMVFTANPSFNGLAANGERICVPSRMAFASRQPEVAAHRAWFRSHGYTIVELPEHIERFEGGGDALWHPDGSFIWAGFGPRTEWRAHDALAEIFHLPVVSLELADARFYHLDTCFCALNEASVMIYPRAFTETGLRSIRERFADVIEVSEEEAVQHLACNATAFHGRVVIIQAGAARIVRELERRNFTVTEVETGEFMKSGGSAFCMKAVLY